MASALIHINSTPHVKPSLEFDPTWMTHRNYLASVRKCNTNKGQHLGAIAGVRKCQPVSRLYLIELLYLYNQEACITMKGQNYWVTWYIAS